MSADEALSKDLRLLISRLNGVRRQMAEVEKSAQLKLDLLRGQEREYQTRLDAINKMIDEASNG